MEREELVLKLKELALDIVLLNEAAEALAQPALERNFCPRCGKRTWDIHTCTAPLENT